MTGTDHDAVRVLTDGGRDQRRVTKTVTADTTVTREVDGEDVEMLRVPISSTRSDREGDRFAREALEDMAEQIRQEQPHVFDNHGLAGDFMSAIPYDSREVIGSQMDAELEEADDGEADLYAYVNPDGSHPEGERMVKQVRDEKQPIKFSVGFGILNHDPIEDDAGNEIGREFTQADLMETSRVGIPANTDASVAMSAKSAPGFGMHPLFRALLGDDDLEAAGATPTAAKGEETHSVTIPDHNHNHDITFTDGGKEEKPKCDDDGDCPDGQVCEDGHCVDAEDTSAAIDALRTEVAELRAEIDALREDGDDGGEGDPCDDNGDCPEGMVCVDGECVDEDDVEDDTDPDDVDALRAEIAEIREALDEGRADPETSDTSTTEPDLTDDDEPDETSDASDPDGSDDAGGPLTNRVP